MTPVLTASDYVQQGLILQLDGIEKGSDPLKWKNLVGEGIISLIQTQILTNGVKLPPGINNILPKHDREDTIEFCFKYDDFLTKTDVPLILPAEYSQYTLRYYHNNYFQYFENSESAEKNAFSVLNYQNNKTTIAFKNAKVIINGKYSQTATKLAQGLKNQPAMGLPGYPYTLYAIRVYNRQLTDDEILYNQRVDNVRFNLGLNLNGEIQPYSPGRSLTMNRDLALDEASPLESFDEPQTTEQEECVNVTER